MEIDSELSVFFYIDYIDKISSVLYLQSTLYLVTLHLKLLSGSNLQLFIHPSWSFWFPSSH